MTEQRFDQHSVPGRAYEAPHRGEWPRPPAAEGPPRVVPGRPAGHAVPRAAPAPTHERQAVADDTAARGSTAGPEHRRAWPTAPITPGGAVAPAASVERSPTARWDADRAAGVGVLDDAPPRSRAGQSAGPDEVFDYERAVAAAPAPAGQVGAAHPMTPFDIAAYGLGIAAFAGVLLVCLAVLAMGGLATVDLVAGLAASAAAFCCGGLALLRLRRERTRSRRLAVMVMAGCAMGLPLLWTLLWRAVVGF